MRRGVVDLVAQLEALGFDDIALTTNATRLAPSRRPLEAAGLTRVNISCDSLRPERFAAIRRRGDLATVLHAMDVAEECGLAPLKVNVVLLRGRNDDEILDFAAFARETGRIVRFIEFMPLDAQGEWDRDSSSRGARSSSASTPSGRSRRCATRVAWRPPSVFASPTAAARSV